jgi:hypothetical protein
MGFVKAWLEGPCFLWAAMGLLELLLFVCLCACVTDADPFL